MKMGDYDLKGESQELIDMKDKISTILNFGKYSAPVLTAAPTWKGREGEHCYSYVANGTAWDFYTYFWINSGWIYMQWVGAATNSAYTWTGLNLSTSLYSEFSALSDRQVQSINIALGGIQSDNMAVDSVFTSAISSGAVTATKIGSNAIIVGHLSANAVTATAISATAVTLDKLAANSVNADKIFTGSILARHLTASVVVISSSAQIQNAIITDAKIKDLTATKITAGTIGAYVIVVGSAGNAGRVVIKGADQVIEVYDTAGTLRVQLGKIS